MTSLEQRMQRFQIQEEDLEERFVLGSGSGGQKINKTSSKVTLKHKPTGIEIACQESRSRERNRELARERLCDRFEQREKEKLLRQARERARTRYKKRRPSAAEKARRLQNKKYRSEKKQRRKRVTE